jgi:hypothetical protein
MRLSWYLFPGRAVRAARAPRRAKATCPADSAGTHPTGPRAASGSLCPEDSLSVVGRVHGRPCLVSKSERRARVCPALPPSLLWPKPPMWGGLGLVVGLGRSPASPDQPRAGLA